MATLDGQVLISADSHLEIDSKYWRDRVPAKHRDRVPKLLHLEDGGDAWLVEGLPLLEIPFDLYGGKGRENWAPFGQSYASARGTGTAEQRLREQDQDGIAAEVLFPGVGSALRLWRNIRDDDAYLAIVRAYNDFLAEEYCATDRNRLIGLGVLPWTNVDDAIAEMNRCARMGLKGVVLGVFPNGKGYPTPDDDRFWAAAVDLGMPITVHQELDRKGPRSGQLFDYGPEYRALRARIGDYGELTNQVAKAAETGAVNAIQLLLAGVFDRFPKLHIFFAETQIGWLPFCLQVADVRYERHRLWTERLLGWKPPKELPSYYLRNHCSWSFQFDRVGVEQRHWLNVEHLMWATDFPHQESEWPNSRRIAERNFAGVPEEETRKMVFENCARLFRLDALAYGKPSSAAAGEGRERALV